MSRIVLSFDVDGTLTVRGEPLKQAAWDMLLRGQPMDVWDGLLAARAKYSGGKGSRYDIVREMLSGIGISGHELECKTEDWVRAYQNVVMSLIKGDVRPEAVTVLSSLKKRYKLYVNSATEEGGLRHCLTEVGLAQFFEEIFGYPKEGGRTKTDILRLILQMEGITPRDLVHIGDSPSDIGAACAVGCLFVGLANDDNRWIPEQESFAVVSSLVDLEKIIDLVL